MRSDRSRPNDGHWCSRCLQNMEGTANHAGHRFYKRWLAKPALKYWEVAMLKRPTAGGDDGKGGTPDRDGALECCPMLWEQLVSDEYDDGHPRQRSTLLLFADGSEAKVCLSDRDLSRVAFGTGASFQEAIGVLERQLQEDRVPWRKASAGRPKK